jgi:hypothetical protein
MREDDGKRRAHQVVSLDLIERKILAVELGGHPRQIVGGPRLDVVPRQLMVRNTPGPGSLRIAKRVPAGGQTEVLPR